ncbi:MAG TPA: hypothetical protein VGG39_35780 [Polyangiaceae bacterium]
MADIEKARRELVGRLVGGGGRASRELRAAAFRDERQALPEPMRGLAEKVVTRASEVRDQDIGAVRAAGLTEDEIFELVVCLAVGETNREYEAALAALDAAEKG